MTTINSINLLPGVFQTSTNQRFLGATLDQLVADSINIPVSGYIGRKFAPTYKLGDNYIPEPTAERQNYQLEPAVTIRDSQNNVIANHTYVDLLNALNNRGGITNNHKRLFESVYYNFDGKFDYDKFVNYNNYYWLPSGPDAVSVSSGNTPLTGNYTVIRNTSQNGYSFSSASPHVNSQITLARGGSYTFTVDQPGNPFWIQAEPGVSGSFPNIPTINTRQVLGVTNNGTDQGTVVFNVPLANAQDFYLQMPLVATVDAAANFNYTDIQNQLLSDFLNKFPAGIDGLRSNLQGKTFIFINNQIDSLFWTTPQLPLGFTGNDTSPITPGSVITSAIRTNIWSINLIPSGNDYLIQIHPTTTVNTVEKVFIGSGVTYVSTEYWLDKNYLYQQIPLITATSDYLYYQDGTNSGYYGSIKLVDNLTVPINVVTDILGQKSYTSPNGVLFTNGLKIQFDSLVVPSTYANNQYYIEGVGQGIQLVPVAQLQVSASLEQLILTNADYITINRSSQDSNGWSRSNRWFHKDIITQTSAYNGTLANFGPNIPARRPIIEFEPNLQLYNHGYISKNNVDILTLSSTDAFVEIEGQQSYILDGVTLVPGMRIIFANDIDPTVKNEVWQVDFTKINNTNYIRLLTTTDDPILVGQNVASLQGYTAGKIFRFDGTNWYECQEKTSINQPPLFDLFDSNGYSFSDPTVYPQSNFIGSQLFSYALGTGINDQVLGFPLSYQNFNNIGDIVFNNFLDTDTFTYTNNNTTVVKNCNSGYVKINQPLGTYTLATNWLPGIENTKQYQIITTFYEGFQISIGSASYAFVQIDVLPISESTIPTLKVFLDNQLLELAIDYQIVQYGIYNVITFTTIPQLGSKIDVLIFSTDTSNLGYYQIPSNLEFNPLNINFNSITSGQLRQHYNKLIENNSYNLTSFPLRDQYIKANGGTILKQSSSLAYSMLFGVNKELNFFDSVDLSRREYQKFKNKFLHACQTLPGLNYNDPISGVDTILQNINAVKNINFPWYYSDMVPQGNNYTTITYTVLNPKQNRYEISSIYNISTLSGKAVLVYHNGQQLLSDGVEFSFSQTSPEIIINIPLAIGDILVIREYASTDGNYIPETPTKLGIYNDFVPEIYTDATYQTPIQAIKGHDGSITPAFGDFRDQYLLELEKRIYNNLKISFSSNNLISEYDTKPGRFRSTDYSLQEWIQLISKNFLRWVGSNNLDYTTNQWFNSNDPWTWNYATSTDSIDGSYLQGSWRAVYNYWFDTDTPHLTPWRMLGISQIPSWWTQRYGPAPYTGSNKVLWGDLEAGYIWNNGVPYTDSRFARPGLSKIIPVDSAGNLLDPLSAGLVKQLDRSNLSAGFQIGQQGPVETAWKNSSDYPFALVYALALARPAEFFSTQIDLNKFYKNPVTGQFTDVNNNHLTPSLLAVNGDTTSVAGSVQRTSGYLNWIADYIKNLGLDPVVTIQNYLYNLNINLSYRTAGFVDSSLLTVRAEQTSPGNTSSSVIVPNDNIDFFIDTSPVPVNTLAYSAVVVTKTGNGYSITGYDQTTPFFTIIPSLADTNSTVISVNNLSVKIYGTSANTTSVVPYGTVYSTVQQVADFLNSYERYLTSQGFVFETFDNDLQSTRDWKLSTKEFLYWVQQNWTDGTLIVLNPIADKLVIKTNNTVVGEITNQPQDSRLLDSNFQVIKNSGFEIIREDSPYVQIGNTSTINIVNGTTLAFAKLNLIQQETTMIVDNRDDFGDIIYVPEQGTRQYRLKLNGSKTGGWDGSLSAVGYVYNNPTIVNWQPETDYRQGDIVLYNNSYYTATQNIPASQTFNLGLWTQITTSDIQTGLLPSLGHNAQIFNHIYDVDIPPQDKNYQTFSSGLIGFRERPFLSNLGVSVPTQTKFYQGYIKEKGTQNSITSLTKATFNILQSNIGVYEEWAFLSGIYGSVKSNQYTEFILNQSVFNTDPVVFTVADNFSTSNLVVNLALTGNTITSNVYNSSNLASTNTSLYLNRTSEYLTDLPTAGYVNLNDIDLQIFDISTYNNTVDNFYVGQKIWVAKDFTGNWNVFRISQSGLVATTITYNLDNYVTVTFNNNHSFVVGDHFVLQAFNINYDGIYTVVNIPTSNSVVILVNNISPLVIAAGYLTGNGNVYLLPSMVVDSDANIGSNIPVGGWITGDRQWVNNDTAPGATGWAVYTYNANTLSWARTGQQQPKVDLNSVGRTFLYNNIDNTITNVFDLYDPNKARLFSTISSDIDFVLAQDPAIYNSGNLQINENYHWGPAQVGKIWWDIESVRYIDYEQSDIIYRLNHWGEQFPGSQISVYEWVESIVPPSQYQTVVGDGIPLYINDEAYSTYGNGVAPNTTLYKYYFWVKDKSSVNVNKNNSVYNIASILSNPASQNIPYAAVLRNDTVALFNTKNYLVGNTQVLHLGQILSNTGVIHSEYTLVQKNNPESLIPTNIDNKLIDSVAGQDSNGNPVPDPLLLPSQSYGINIRPRQSMFVNRQTALNNYVSFVNTELLGYPIVERKTMTILNSQESAPPASFNVYDKIINNNAELNYIDTSLITAGYRVLVLNDATQNTRWSIYTWSLPTSNQWNLTRVQSYKTNLYWSYVDWYASWYDPTVLPDVTVANKIEFGKLILVPNTYIKILDNGSSQFQVYYIDASKNKNLVGLQNGTIQLSTGNIPPLELRQILTAIKTQIFIDDLAIKYNQLFFTMVNYALSEQKNIDWVFKTSFISATQYIRRLDTLPAYIADNQNYYLEYINEVKPYRTSLREFIVDYEGLDQYLGDTTDFDLQPYWDANLQIYRSPNGEQLYDANLFASTTYLEWNNHYKYQVVGIEVERPGTGYISPPIITIVGGNGTGAAAYATIDANLGIGSVTVTSSGSGYTSIPTININGTGTGALLRPILKQVNDGNGQGHNLIRNLSTTIKFDRVNYTNANTFVFWSNITTANIGETISGNTILSLNNQLYLLPNNYVIDATLSWPSEANLVPVSYSDFNNANDRIVASLGNVDITLTQPGLEYPGVIVDGNTFVGNVYDINIQSFYSNVFGVNPNDIITDGGQYVGRYSSYAPEELIPGRMYDSVNMMVFDTSLLGFRIFDRYDNSFSFQRIAEANTTVLTANLSLADTTIQVADAARLPAPSLKLNQPGVIYVNGEKITYWRNYALETPTTWSANLILPVESLVSYNSNLYVTIGNVYSNTANFSAIISNVTSVSSNTLSQIMRGVDMTAIQQIHTTGSRVMDASNSQYIPYSDLYSSPATANLYTVTDQVSYILELTANITANINDTITQVKTIQNWQSNYSPPIGSYVYYSGNSYITTGNVYGTNFTDANVSANITYAFSGNILTTATLTCLDSVINSSRVPIVVQSGQLQGLPDEFDNPAGFDAVQFDNIVGTTYVNGVATTAYVLGTTILGEVNSSGQVAVSIGTLLEKSNSWYSLGAGTITNGQTLINSTTPQANFLKDQLTFPINPGNTV